MEFGIAAFGSALGKRTAVADVVHDYTEDTARVLGQGYYAIHVAGQDVGLTGTAPRRAAPLRQRAGAALGHRPRARLRRRRLHRQG